MVETNVADIGTSPYERPVRPERVAIAGGVANFTDSSGGTASDTLPSINSTFDETEVEDLEASMAAKVVEILAVQELILTALRDAEIIAT